MTNDPVELPYDEKIADLERQLEAARQSTLALEGQLEWWKRGRELYGHAATNGNATELVPEEHVFQTGTKPTLAQGIVRVMKSAQPGKETWTTTQVMAELRDRGWMPNGSSAEQVVRARLARMAREDGGLKRVEHGIYALSDSPTATLIPAEGP
jgi:exonuclease VII small subunit